MGTGTAAKVNIGTLGNPGVVSNLYGYDWTGLLTNGSFETGDLTGWTAISLGGDSEFLLADSETVPGISYTLAGPGDGSWYTVATQGDPSATALIQAFTVPVDDNDVVLTFDMFVLDTSGVGPIDAGGLDYTLGTNQHACVDILSAVAGTFDTGGGVVRNLYLDVDGYTAVLPYISYSFDLSDDLTPGETYLLRFAEVDNQAPLHIGVDKVSIRSK